MQSAEVLILPHSAIPELNYAVRDPDQKPLISSMTESITHGEREVAAPEHTPKVFQVRSDSTILPPRP